jgi:hypothetical protein
MFETEILPLTERYRVEVSGWDESEVFFVEHSELAWDEFAGKHVSLDHMLLDGTIIFVRMLQPMALRQTPPIAYQVEFIGCNPEGGRQFRLNGVQPRQKHESPLN